MKTLMIVLIVVIGLSFGCSNDSKNTNSTELANNAPVIQNVEANPPLVNAGERSILTCVATDEDRDSLEYTWNYLAGNIYDYYDSGRRAGWYSPNQQGEYYVKVTVNDGMAVDIDSVAITVN